MTTPTARYNRLRGAYECTRCLGTGVEPPAAPAGEVDRTAIDRLMDELDDIAARREAARLALADIDPAPLPE